MRMAAEAPGLQKRLNPFKEESQTVGASRLRGLFCKAPGRHRQRENYNQQKLLILSRVVTVGVQLEPHPTMVAELLWRFLVGPRRGEPNLIYTQFSTSRMLQKCLADSPHFPCWP